MSKSRKTVNKKQRAIIRLFVYIFMAIAIICLSAFATVKIFNGAFGENEEVKVPYLVGLHKDEAKQQLEYAGLIMEIQANIISNEYPKDYVISQVYDEGYGLKPGATVGVTLSKGAKQILVPDVTTMSIDAAKIEIEKYGLKFTLEEEASSDVAEGEIIRQEPVFNTEIAEGETVIVYISTGVPDGLVKVPDVTKYEELQAKDVLTKMNLTVNVVYEAKYTEKEGKILSQSPEAGEMVSEFTEVTLVINKYESQESEDEKTPDGENQESNDNKPNDNKPDEPTKPEYQYITVDLSRSGVRDTFVVRVELLGDISGRKVLYEATHKRSDGSIKVPVSADASGLIRVYIDNVFESEMPL